MTEQHPITPPPELVQHWYNVAREHKPDYEFDIATQAARWGANQELEACCEWLDIPNNRSGDRGDGWLMPGRLRRARRPKPPSLKEQAMKALLEADGPDHPVPVLVLPIEDAVVIRRALEQLDD